jgi:uroporphyrin-3 C-methyltransferase
MTDPIPNVNAVPESTASVDAVTPAVRPARSETALRPGWCRSSCWRCCWLGVAGYLMLERMRGLEAELHKRVAAVGAQAVEATRASEQDAAGIASYGARLGSQEAAAGRVACPARSL